jgi:multidrug efflux pump
LSHELLRVFIERPGRHHAADDGAGAGRRGRVLPAAGGAAAEVDMPTIFVTARCPAPARRPCRTSVATPLERHLGTIADVNEMTSSSSVGSTRIVLQFGLDRDIDGAARDVQAAINAARADLPTALRSNPTYRKINPADAAGPDPGADLRHADAGQIYDAASTILQQKLSQVQGIGRCSSAAARCRRCASSSIRARCSNTASGWRTCARALRGQRQQPPRARSSRAPALSDLRQRQAARGRYRSLIVAYRNGARCGCPTSPRSRRRRGRAQSRHGQRQAGGALVILFRQPGANIIETVDSVKARCRSCRPRCRPASDPRIVANDRTTSIRASLRDVERTLVIAIALVMLVVFCSCATARRLIPCIAVPLSLIGTFGGDVSAGLQPRQSVADGADGGHRLRGRRRHRGAGERHAPHRGRHAALEARCWARARSASRCWR